MASPSTTPLRSPPPHPARSDRPTPSSRSVSRRDDGSGGQNSAVARLSDVQSHLSVYRQEILTEEEYTEAISKIIKRDFFPTLAELDAAKELAARRRVGSESEWGGRTIRTPGGLVTPTPHRTRNADVTPGQTPFASEPSDTPLHPSRTLYDTPRTSFDVSGGTSDVQERYDTSLSLDAFQATYTSEDNASFSGILDRQNQAKRVKYSWAYGAENEANRKLIKAREGREKLVEMSRMIVEGNGNVGLLEGGEAGRPGERQLIMRGEESRPLRWKVLSKDEEKKLIEDGRARVGDALQEMRAITMGGEEGDAGKEGGAVDEDLDIFPAARVDKGKGKEVIIAPPTTNGAQSSSEAGPSKSVGETKESGMPDVWPFKTRNSLMFPPDVDEAPMNRVPRVREDDLRFGPPKQTIYANTRLDDPELSRSDIAPSPSHSNIAAAIAGTPHPSRDIMTPKVNGFGYVSTMPSPSPSKLGEEGVNQLMTWGKIQSTPIALRPFGEDTPRDPRGDDEDEERIRKEREEKESKDMESYGAFKIPPTPRREVLANQMAKKASKSLRLRSGIVGSSQTKNRLGILGLGSKDGRSPFDARVGGSPRGGGSTRREDLLSPAGKKLLDRTIGTPSRLSQMGSGKRKPSDEEVERQERLKRARWTPSPSPARRSMDG